MQVKKKMACWDGQQDLNINEVEWCVWEDAKRSNGPRGADDRVHARKRDVK